MAKKRKKKIRKKLTKSQKRTRMENMRIADVRNYSRAARLRLIRLARPALGKALLRIRKNLSAITKDPEEMIDSMKNLTPYTRGRQSSYHRVFGVHPQALFGQALRETTKKQKLKALGKDIPMQLRKDRAMLARVNRRLKKQKDFSSSWGLAFEDE